MLNFGRLAVVFLATLYSTLIATLTKGMLLKPFLTSPVAAYTQRITFSTQLLEQLENAAFNLRTALVRLTGIQIGHDSHKLMFELALASDVLTLSQIDAWIFALKVRSKVLSTRVSSASQNSRSIVSSIDIKSAVLKMRDIDQNVTTLLLRTDRTLEASNGHLIDLELSRRARLHLEASD